MKKVIMSAVAGTMFFSTAIADQTVVTAHEEPAIVVDEAGVEEHYSEEPSLGGISLMLGIGGNFVKIKSKSAAKNDCTDKTANRFMGTVGLGAGKVFSNSCYLGIETLFDFTKSKTYDSVLKVGGCMPSIGVRLGYAFRNDSMIYARIAGSWIETKAYAKKNTELKNSKIAPSVALGFEKAFSNKFSGRIEGEYRFSSKKNGTLNNGVKDVDCELKADNAFNIRALISYNIKF